MTINFVSEFSSNSHPSKKRIALIPLLATIFLVLSHFLPMVSVMKISYAEEHYFNSQIDHSNFNVMYDNKSLIFEKSYEDWTAEWWKWAYSIPINENPAYDDYGIKCNYGQDGPVWFLSGTFNHSAHRSCLVPDNVGILFPILNSECSYIDYPLKKSKEGLMMCAKSIQDQVDFLNATLDDQILLELENYRIQSPMFNFTLPANNLLNLTRGETSAAISDGNWVFLKPLAFGKHTITFEGGYSNGSKGNNGIINNNMSFGLPIGWDYETSYDLMVLPSDLYFHNKYVSYPNERSMNSSINTGDILEQNLIRIHNNFTNEYQAVENVTIMDYLKKSDGWIVLGDTPQETQSLSKVFSFDSFPKSVKFSYLVSELAQMLNHHPVIHIDWDKVTIELYTWALGNSISDFDIRSSILIDQLYELVVKDDL